MLERLLRALKDLAISEQTLFNTYWMRLKLNEDFMFILKYSKRVYGEIVWVRGRQSQNQG